MIADRSRPRIGTSSLLVFLLCAVALIPAGCGAIGGYGRSLRHDTLTVSGQERTYSLYVPPNLPQDASAPLVFILHGGGGTGKGMVWLTRGGFNLLADKNGFIVVYPDGMKRHWNDGRTDAGYFAHREKIDDVAFVSALIGKLAKEWNIDPKRVYAAGISNGAMMSFRLACELSGSVAAVAAIAGSVPKDIASTCSPSRPVPVLIMNGTHDLLVPWSGGYILPNWGKKFGEVVSVSDTVKLWVAKNGCSPRPAQSQAPDADPADGTTVRKEAYGSCREQSEVVLYTVENGGHAWPGGRQYLPERFIGKTSRDIDACEIIWEFFKRHRRP